MMRSPYSRIMLLGLSEEYYYKLLEKMPAKCQNFKSEGTMLILSLIIKEQSSF